MTKKEEEKKLFPTEQASNAKLVTTYTLQILHGNVDFVGKMAKPID